MVEFCIVEGNAKEFLEGKYSMNQTVSRYLKELLKQNENGNLPETNFHEFMYSYYSKGQDPFLPIVKKQDNNIQLTGLALFEKDKYVDKINADKMFEFKMLYEDIDPGSYETSFQENETHVSLETVQSKLDYKIKDAMSRPEIEINVEIKGFLNEIISNVELKTITDEENLEKLLEDDLKEKSYLLIKQFREKDLDPLGIADRARSQTRGWSLNKWQELYPEATVKININVDILETGITKGML
jgi:spore germination protein